MMMTRMMIIEMAVVVWWAGGAAGGGGVVRLCCAVFGVLFVMCTPMMMEEGSHLVLALCRCTCPCHVCGVVLPACPVPCMSCMRGRSAEDCRLIKMHGAGWLVTCSFVLRAGTSFLQFEGLEAGAQAIAESGGAGRGGSLPATPAAAAAAEPAFLVCV